MDEEQVLVSNWKAAQALPISIDLIAAAKQELDLLAQVDRHPCLYGGPVLLRAIERYENFWLPLLDSEGKVAEEGLPLIPPLDCDWVWHCHRLNPVQYAKDCDKLYGRILDTPVVNPAERQTATDATRTLWQSKFQDEPYEVDISEARDAPVVQKQDCDGGNEALPTVIPSNVANRITYNLVDAVSRQKSFYYQVSQPHVVQNQFLQSAAQRYKGFLYLFTRNNGTFLVPTYDVDIMWHAHQRSATAYSRDCISILKWVLEHDDTDSDRGEGQKLNTGFKDTCKLWENTYGTIYVKAGAMYRGDQPLLAQPPPVLEDPDFTNRKLVCLEQQQQHSYLTERRTVQVCLVLIGARNVPTRQTEPTLFVRVKVLNKCKSFELDTYEVPTSSDPVWRRVFMMRFEVGTEGLILQLHSSRMGMFSSGSKLLGEANLTWATLLASPSLSIRTWLPLSKRNFFGISSSAQAPIELDISASVTPPVIAPYLLRAVKAQDNDLHGSLQKTQENHPLTSRIVLDHADREIFFVQAQSAGNANARQWALYDGGVQLTVVKNSQDDQWHLRPEFKLQGYLGFPVRLLAGRKLDYEVKGATVEEEAGFVTVIRYTLDYPLGKSTALFNTRSGAMEVTAEESVPLVVLLSTIISISVVDMLGTTIPSPPKIWRTNFKGKPNRNEWGSVVMERAGNEKSDLAQKLANYNLLNYQFWWDMPFLYWCASFYSNPLILSYRQAYEQGALLGDGRTATEM
ncbi:unnamed protein product [Sphagnum troendelagicum]